MCRAQSSKNGGFRREDERICRAQSNNGGFRREERRGCAKPRAERMVADG